MSVIFFRVTGSFFGLLAQWGEVDTESFLDLVGHDQSDGGVDVGLPLSIESVNQTLSALKFGQGASLRIHFCKSIWNEEQTMFLK